MFMQVMFNGWIIFNSVLLLIFFFFLDIENWKEEESYMRHYCNGYIKNYGNGIVVNFDFEILKGKAINIVHLMRSEDIYVRSIDVIWNLCIKKLFSMNIYYS